MSTTDTSQPVVVVGVDGSPNSIAAIEWAASYLASSGGGTLKAVMSWTYPAAAVSSMGIGGAVPPADAMHEATVEALAEVLGGIEIPESVTVESHALEGAPSSALIESGKDADLIVIGKRGHGGFLGLLMGSVATQVVNHAPCPVVVVPAAD
ncbi:MAG: universal stress protein [Actinobacteria bacterium]|nr:universal stress protein [Actinomycetota bacterium]